MLKINKIKPDFFDKLVKNKTQWSELNNQDKQQLHNKLSEEQKKMCAYCESQIKNDNAHIDHFYKRNLFPKQTFEYNNLFKSCNNENHCAKHKDKFKLKKEDFKNFYSPLDINLEEFNYNLLTGEIIGLTPKAQKTIEVFNLNHTTLKYKRETIIKQLSSYQDMDFDLSDLFEAFGEFINLLDYYIKDD
jgi:uncharacterized protein (TIGR02646 family)